MIVALGGALGSLTRFWLQTVIALDTTATLIANLFGVALAVFFLVLMERRGITELRWFLLPGFCGGMTTFSAVTVQVVDPQDGGFSYLVLTVIASLIVAHATMVISRKVVKVK